MVSPKINILSEQTIDKIAAGEVIERPSSVAKELVENAIDAGATRIVVEIKGGGIELLRVTDNGCGILKSELPHAFLRHTTSKIKDADDIIALSSLGFRGEALSSITSCAHVECITKTSDEILGTRYIPDTKGGGEMSDIGAPDGTTFIIRDLFYNTPARYKFLKSDKTEGGYIASLIEKLALSRPEIAFQLISDGRVRLSTPGSNSLKDAIFAVYGAQIARELIEIDNENELFKIRGFLGKPILSRGNRSLEILFANGRYVKSKNLQDAILDGYRGLLMGHQFPFYVLFTEFPADRLDVNVHPSKTEIRVFDEREVCARITEVISDTLSHKDYAVETNITDSNYDKTETPAAKLAENAKKPASHVPEAPQTIHTEPFETKRLEKIRESVKKDSPYEPKYVQQTLLSDGIFARKDNKEKYELIGQVFDTYWIIQFEDKMFLMDQHAAHEKVLFERTLNALKEKTVTSQSLMPPAIITLSPEELSSLDEYGSFLSDFGYAFEPFGGHEIAVTAVPADLYEIDLTEAFHGFLGQLMDKNAKLIPDVIYDKIATMSCKAAIKGNNSYSFAEAKALLEELFTLDDPYHCPHGRPTLITMTHQELDKKFKRIVG